jgi:WD40 repeat protein
MSHKTAIENSPLQAYTSALLFSPARSLTRRLFKHEEPKWIMIKPPIRDEWSACLQTLDGHSSGVYSVAFSHDSTHLASASDDNTVKIWDASSGACLQTLDGHSDTVYSVAFSHDSTHLASASYDNTVKIWDASSGACLQTLDSHSGTVYSVAFSHDSTHLASASYDNTVKIWDASSGACLQTLNGHSSEVNSVAFSHDSRRLASASWDNTVKIWDTSSGACLQTLTIGKTLYTISFNDAGSYLHTEIGTIAVNVPSALDTTPSITKPQDARFQGFGLCSDEAWIKYDSENVLWLPSEYRPSCSAVSAETVGIGVGSGKVWMCSFNVESS